MANAAATALNLKHQAHAVTKTTLYLSLICTKKIKKHSLKNI